MFSFENTPYLLDTEAEKQVLDRLNKIEERIFLLRGTGTLSPKTLINYYGEKRFEQVAESNAIEGSTLSAGETELAVAKGITITGHDPGFVRDAISLDRALTRTAELARDHSIPTNIAQLHEIHELILGDRPGGGVFRKDRVSISGARHTPPKTWQEIMQQMEQWENWSKENKDLPAPIRASILHAWLTHTHPYIDGNGRVSRAIGNLELIRAGYPPIIIKKKERERYIESLAESDDGGDIRSFLEFIFEKIDASLTGLENSARKGQGYSQVAAKIRKKQEQQLFIWNNSVKLLASLIDHHLTREIESVNGLCQIRIYNEFIDFEDFIELCSGRTVSGGWAFQLRIDIPGLRPVEKLAFIGHRSFRILDYLNQEGGPSIFWSHRDPVGIRRWTKDERESPYAMEVTSKLGQGDHWIARLNDDTVVELQTTELAKRISDALIGQVGS